MGRKGEDGLEGHGQMSLYRPTVDADKMKLRDWLKTAGTLGERWHTVPTF